MLEYDGLHDGLLVLDSKIAVAIELLEMFGHAAYYRGVTYTAMASMVQRAYSIANTSEQRRAGGRDFNFTRDLMARIWRSFLGLVKYPPLAMCCPLCPADQPPKAVVVDALAVGLLTPHFTAHSISKGVAKHAVTPGLTHARSTYVAGTGSTSVRRLLFNYFGTGCLQKGGGSAKFTHAVELRKTLMEPIMKDKWLLSNLEAIRPIVLALLDRFPERCPAELAPVLYSLASQTPALGWHMPEISIPVLRELAHRCGE